MKRVVPEAPVAIFKKAIIHGNGVKEMKVRCPHCGNRNRHIVTDDFNEGNHRECHYSMCGDGSGYNLPKLSYFLF